jgi:MFS family permease
VFQEYYQTHQLIHETSSAISWIGSLQTFFLFGGSLVGGPLFDRFGAKVSLSITIYIWASTDFNSTSRSYGQQQHLTSSL